MALLYDEDMQKVVLVFTPDREKTLRAKMLLFAQRKYPGARVRTRNVVGHQSHDLETADVVLIRPEDTYIGEMYSRKKIKVIAYNEGVSGEQASEIPVIAMTPAQSPESSFPEPSFSDVPEVAEAQQLANKPPRGKKKRPSVGES
jgi:hypothetical protein